jgi:hypothetical protein
MTRSRSVVPPRSRWPCTSYQIQTLVRIGDRASPRCVTAALEPMPLLGVRAMATALVACGVAAAAAARFANNNNRRCLCVT